MAGGQICCERCFHGYSNGQWVDECNNECGLLQDLDLQTERNRDYPALVRNVDRNRDYMDECGCEDPATSGQAQFGEGMIELRGLTVHCPTICWLGREIVTPVYDHIQDK